MANRERKTSTVSTRIPPPPQTIFEHLNGHIVGHYVMKKALSVAVYNHYCETSIRGVTHHPVPASTKETKSNQKDFEKLAKQPKSEAAGALCKHMFNPDEREADGALNKPFDSNANALCKLPVGKVDRDPFSTTPSRTSRHTERRDSEFSDGGIEGGVDLESGEYLSPIIARVLIEASSHKVHLKKGNVLTFDPTGSSRPVDAIAANIAKFLDVPYVKCDCSKAISKRQEQMWKKVPKQPPQPVVKAKKDLSIDEEKIKYSRKAYRDIIDLLAIIGRQNWRKMYVSEPFVTSSKTWQESVLRKLREISDFPEERVRKLGTAGLAISNPLMTEGASDWEYEWAEINLFLNIVRDRLERALDNDDGKALRVSTESSPGYSDPPSPRLTLAVSDSELENLGKSQKKPSLLTRSESHKEPKSKDSSQDSTPPSLISSKEGKCGSSDSGLGDEEDSGVDSQPVDFIRKGTTSDSKFKKFDSAKMKSPKTKSMLKKRERQEKHALRNRTNSNDNGSDSDSGSECQVIKNTPIKDEIILQHKEDSSSSLEIVSPSTKSGRSYHNSPKATRSPPHVTYSTTTSLGSDIEILCTDENPKTPKNSLPTGNYFERALKPDLSEQRLRQSSARNLQVIVEDLPLSYEQCKRSPLLSKSESSQRHQSFVASQCPSKRASKSESLFDTVRVLDEFLENISQNIVKESEKVEASETSAKNEKRKGTLEMLLQGYVGETIENMVTTKLFNNADYDPNKACRGIVFLDGIDKIGNNALDDPKGLPTIQRDIIKEIQEMIEGTELTTEKKDVEADKTDVLTIDSSNLFFICFGVKDQKQTPNDQPRERRNSISRGRREPSRSENAQSSSIQTPSSSNRQQKQQELYRREDGTFLSPSSLRFEEGEEVESEDSEEDYYGSYYDDEEEDDSFRGLKENRLCEIMKQSKEDIIPTMCQEVWGMKNVELVVNPEAMEIITDQALAQNTGRDGVYTILEKILFTVKFDIPSDMKVSKVEITEETVLGKGPPIYHDATDTNVFRQHLNKMNYKELTTITEETDGVVGPLPSKIHTNASSLLSDLDMAVMDMLEV